MKSLAVITFALILAAPCAPAQQAAAAQQAVADPPSLADTVRALQKNKAATPRVTTFTNDNLPSDAVVNVTGKLDAPKSDADSAASETKDAATDASKDAKAVNKPLTPADTQKLIADWRGKISTQQKDIASQDHEIDLMQREYRMRVASFYADAGNRLRNDKQWAEDEQKYKDDLAGKTAKLEDSKQKLAQMKEDAFRAGVPGGALDDLDSAAGSSGQAKAGDVPPQS